MRAPARDLDYVAIEDVGRAVNPHIVHGQAIGALVQGLGGVFLDQCSTTATRRSSTRRSPTIRAAACDFPNVRAITMELRRSRPTARRQGCGRGRHGGGCGDGRQCGGGGARSSRRRGARAAAVARASVAAGRPAGAGPVNSADEECNS